MLRSQDQINLSVYSRAGVHRLYLSRTLTPSEVACLLKYQPHFCGRDVLDIGVGAGRTTRYLAPLARRYEGIDFSPVMVDYMKRTMSHISVRKADFRDLRMFSTDSFDFIFATDNVIDALSHEGRMDALKEAARVLRPGGLLVFSSHNLRYARAFDGPRISWSANPLRLAAGLIRFAQSWRNHIRVRSLRQTASDHAILNDPGHFYACLHYYLTRSTVSAQLQSAGMQLLETFDREGRSLSEQDDESHSSSLTYVARLAAVSPSAPDIAPTPVLDHAL